MNYKPFNDGVVYVSSTYNILCSEYEQNIGVWMGGGGTTFNGGIAL
jgi:hypothetical protein